MISHSSQGPWRHFKGSVCEIKVEYFCLPLWSSLCQVLLHDRWLPTSWPCSISSQPAFHSQCRATNPASFQKTCFLLKKEKYHSWWQPWRKTFWAWSAGLENWNTERAGHSSMVCHANTTDHPSVFSTSNVPFHLVVPLIPFPFCQHDATSLKHLVVAALSPLSSFLCFPSFASPMFYMQNVTLILQWVKASMVEHSSALFLLFGQYDTATNGSG